ncbi:ABC transporter permease [Humidisolicoccus flavus]|uniref:ABC transporter permease n=1 Tax=Humidisolicoccus flavus TaxID=3111414 RepID=UPI0032569B23
MLIDPLARVTTQALSPVPRRRLSSRPPILVTLAALWLLVLTALAFGISFIPGIDPRATDYNNLVAAPSLGHLFGTDNLGRDVFVRTMFGAQASIMIAALVIVVGGGAGLLLGVIGGYLRGPFDAIIGFATDVLMALPALLLVITVVTLRGPSLLTIGLILAILAIPAFSRIARAATRSVTRSPYVVAARTLGASPLRIMLREVLPAVVPIVTPFALTAIASAIIAEGAMSFLGFGLQPPAPSWGGLIADGRSQLASAPWVTMLPAAVLCGTILAVNVIGEHLRKESGRQ